MAIITRQTSLLAAEDWTKIYQTFKDADFQSYDFETIRKSMIDYLRLYYPEDFNDYIESSEFIALVDLIAFLGQGLAYRNDLNTRENFIDTAERRESILRLAKLVSYTTKRAMPASGILKINEITTTEQLYDSNGINLANTRIEFNDGTNANWLEQFNVVLNASLQSSQKIGQPNNRNVLAGVTTDEYTLNLVPDTLPIFLYQNTVDGTGMDFEVTSVTTQDKEYWYEMPPRQGQDYNILYRNDNLGNSSINTGYFVYFKQGTIRTIDFGVNDAIPNRIVNINFPNINQTDVWLYLLDDNDDVSKMWVQVPAVSGQNIAYNSVASSDRDVYQVVTNSDDSINLIFGDGIFASIPRGKFRIYFRVSSGSSYKITPDEMGSVTVPYEYVSRSGRVETITMVSSLQYSVANASARETTDDIKQRAPQQYYTQNRMVNGEDYNIFPYTSYNNIIKVKAVNRTSSGISRFLDVLDTTGKYSSTNIFCEDGWLYEEDLMDSFRFEYLYISDIITLLRTQVKNIIDGVEMTQFYYANFDRYDSPPSGMFWNKSTSSSNQSTGYFTEDDGDIVQLGPIVAGTTRFVTPGALLKFVAPEGYFFNSANVLEQLVENDGYSEKKRTEIFSAVMSVVGDGTGNGHGTLESGLGPITLSDVIPTGVPATIIIPYFSDVIPITIENEVVENMLSNNDFGLRYDVNTLSWALITSDNLNKSDDFSLIRQGDISGQQKDASWLVMFESNESAYTITSHGLQYIFESKLETRFYYDEDLKVFDSKTGNVIHDYIKVLKVNPQPDSSEPMGVDTSLFIYANIVEEDGYHNTSKIKVTYADHDSDGVPDNPDFFDDIVAPKVNSENKYVFFEKTYEYSNFESLSPVEGEMFNTEFLVWSTINENINNFEIGQLFYATYQAKFWQIENIDSSRVLVELEQYVAKVGRQNMYFQYRHNSPNNRRIDPSPNNIIDLFLLTRQYAEDYTNWVGDITNTVEEPAKPSSTELRVEFNTLDDFKMVSDTLIYNSASFKPLFGEQADPSLQAIFKVVKNTSLNISDSQVKAKMISALNKYFDINYWDFGETFFFTELSSYLHQELSPDVASIIIVPRSTLLQFGALFQVNCEPYEILTSAATVEDVQIISAITAAQLRIESGDN